MSDVRRDREDPRDVESGFLFATPSIWSGVGRVLDFWGVFDTYNYSSSTEEADARALYSDWRIVGQDLRGAWRNFHEYNAERTSRQGFVYCSECAKQLHLPLKQIHGRKE